MESAFSLASADICCFKVFHGPILYCHMRVTAMTENTGFMLIARSF